MADVAGPAEPTTPTPTVTTSVPRGGGADRDPAPSKPDTSGWDSGGYDPAPAPSKSVGRQDPEGGGGGGNGGVASPATSGTAGTANTGGGGGCAENGGSGVVILKMATADYSSTVTGSPTVTTSGSDTIVKFTGTVTYTV